MGFMNLGKACDKANRETLCQVSRIYDVADKILNSIKRMYVIVYLVQE